MLEEIIPVIIGGLLALAGGTIQSYITVKNVTNQKRNEARENAYLSYIDALLKIRVDDEYGRVKTKEFWESFCNVQAKLRLYGSKNIINESQNFEGHLYECFQCGNIDIGNTEILKMSLIDSMRKELHID